MLIQNPKSIYPCLCLCFGFSQITRTIPLRCITLHLSQIFFTEGRTFIIFSSLSVLKATLQIAFIYTGKLSARDSDRMAKAQPKPYHPAKYG